MSETDSSLYVLLHKLGIWQRASFSNSQIFCSGIFSVVIYSNMHTVGMHFSVATHGMQLGAFSVEPRFMAYLHYSCNSVYTLFSFLLMANFEEEKKDFG